MRISVSKRRYDEDGSRAVDEKQELEAKAFIFDKDGTLLTHDHFVPIMEKRLELLTERYQLSDQDRDKLSQLLGLDPKTHEIIPHGTMFIARADTKLLIEAFLGEKGYRGVKLREHVDKIFRDADAQVELEKYLRPISGVPELLGRLKAHGARIAIATHDSTEAARKQLAISNLDQYIDLIVGLDYNGNILHKPSPSMLLTVCQEFGIVPVDAVVIGDSANDALMGISGGAGLSIGVLTGEHDVNDFKECDAILDSVVQLEVLD